MNIQIKVEFEAISIFINDILHLWIDRTKLLGVQSWIKTGRKQFFIEIILENGNITSDYDNIEKWKIILEGIVYVLRTGKEFNGSQSKT